MLVTATVRDLVLGSGLRFDDARARRLKGVQGPVGLHRAVDR